MSLDFYIAAAIGITRGASLQVVSDKLTELNDINSVGAFKTALVVAQMMIGDGFMVRLIPCSAWAGSHARWAAGVPGVRCVE